MDKVMISGNSMEFLRNEGDVPARLPLIMAGRVIEGVDGRSYINSDPSGVVERYKARGRMIPVDIEHSTQRQGAQGLPAPAVGWITDMDVSADGVVKGAVDWTDEGRALILANRYKYYSPAYGILGDGTIAEIVSVGLTNVPNLPVPALNQAEEGKGEDMEMKVVCNALGIEEGASESDVLVEINAIRSRCDDALKRAEKAEAELARIEGETLKVEINAAIDKAVSDGKVMPAQKGYFLGAVKTREELNAFTAYVKESASMLPAAEIVTGKPVEAEVSLNADEKAMTAMMGVSEEDYRKAKKEGLIQ